MYVYSFSRECSVALRACVGVMSEGKEFFAGEEEKKGLREHLWKEGGREEWRNGGGKGEGKKG